MLKPREKTHCTPEVNMEAREWALFHFSTLQLTRDNLQTAAEGRTEERQPIRPHQAGAVRVVK